MAHHDDVESVEAEDPREDSDEGAKEAIPTEEGKDIGCEEDDEGEEMSVDFEDIEDGWFGVSDEGEECSLQDAKAEFTVVKKDKQFRWD